jgi:hypothetical protein
VRGLVLAMLATAVVAGCSSGEQNQPAPSSPTSTASTTARDSAVEAYQGMWLAFSHASETADWQSPDLARYASGNALAQLTKSLQANQVRGVVTRGTFVTQPSVASADPPNAPTTVRILDCGDDSVTTRVHASNGQTIPGSGGGKHRIDAEVRLLNGSWSVVDFRLRSAGSC